MLNKTMEKHSKSNFIESETSENEQEKSCVDHVQLLAKTYPCQIVEKTVYFNGKQLENSTE